ncbi:MAG: gamma-glutamylcyclotransferase family protein [Myxococcota bacterium]
MPYVFVYGPDSLQARMYDRLGACEAIGGANVEGYALAFNKPDMKSDAGLPNLTKTAGSTAFGVLYDLTRKQIEMLEGYYGGYLREDVTAALLPPREGEEIEPEVLARRPKAPVTATAYIARRIKSGLKPQPEALALTKKGAEENGAPPAFIESIYKAVSK